MSSNNDKVNSSCGDRLGTVTGPRRRCVLFSCCRNTTVTVDAAIVICVHSPMMEQRGRATLQQGEKKRIKMSFIPFFLSIQSIHQNQIHPSIHPSIHHPITKSTNFQKNLTFLRASTNHLKRRTVVVTTTESIVGVHRGQNTTIASESTMAKALIDAIFTSIELALSQSLHLLIPTHHHPSCHCCCRHHHHSCCSHWHLGIPWHWHWTL